MSKLNAIETPARASAPRIVYLHGFGGHAGVWDRIIQGLGDVYHHTAFDLPGHGGSLDHPAVGGAGRMSKAVAESLTDLSEQPVHLVGHSMGGAVAALTAHCVVTRHCVVAVNNLDTNSAASNHITAIQA